MALNLIIFGPPGVGKGTQAQILAKHANIVQVSTGDIFRANIKNETPLGMKAKEYMDKGALVPDDLVISIVEDKLKQPDLVNGFILDGFPRTVIQAGKLHEAMQKLDKKINGVINLMVDDEEIVKRLGTRRVCLKCGATYNLDIAPPKVEGVCDKCGDNVILRDDDKPETILVRLENYKKQTEPVLGFYAKFDIVKNVKSEGGIDAVSIKIQSIVNTL